MCFNLMGFVDLKSTSFHYIEDINQLSQIIFHMVFLNV